MKTNQVYLLAMTVGAAISAASILMVAILVSPEGTRSDYFWARVLWTEFLALLLWGSAASFLLLTTDEGRDSTRHFAGISPAVSVVVTCYVGASFFAMLADAYFGDQDSSSILHLAGQVALAAAFGISVVFLLVASASASSGVAFDEESVLRPAALCAELALIESQLTSRSSGEEVSALSASLKGVREAIKASLHESTACSQSQEYQQFATEIESLCQSLSIMLSSDISLGNEDLDTVQRTTTHLKARVAFVAASLVSR